VTIDLAAIAIAIVTAIVSTATSHVLLGWRMRDAERRLKALDDPKDGALTRLTRLETRRAH
jgi:hypothetical protein